MIKYVRQNTRIDSSQPTMQNYNWFDLRFCCRDIAGKYAGEMRALVLRLLAAISEALGLDSNYLNTNLGKHSQLMSINYYPSCPNPDLTLGLANHSDASVITVLMQSDVSGLQVFKNAKWVAVEPIADAFVVNLGDQLQVRMSRSIYLVLSIQ